MAFVMVMTANVWGMQVYVHYANGTWPTDIADYHFNSSSGNLIIEIESSGSIGEVKDKIADKSGFEAANITLSFGTYADLDDSYTLAYYNITSESTINMTYADPTQPQRVTDNNWRVQTMPRGDRVLRTIWKQACELAFEKDTTVYRGFSFEGQPLTNPHNLSVTYSSSNTNVATVATDGTVTVKGVGNATITATTTGNDDYQACSASYNIQVKEPYKLTLLTVGNGTVDIDGITLPPGVIVDTAHYSGNDKHYLVKPGTGAVDLEATPNLLNYLVNWSNNVTVSNDNPLNAFVMLSDHVTVTATFAPYPILVVEKEGVGDVEVVGVTRTAQSESINTTVSGYNTFSGTLFTVNSQSYASDGKGFTIGHLADETMSEPLSATITANNHQTIIDSVKIVRQQTQTPINCSFADMTVDHGTYTYSGDTATVRGVNATSLTIGIQNEWDNSSLWISTVKVFYTDVTVVSTIDHVTTTEGDVYTIEPGTDVQLTATAGTNYHFDNWSWGTGSDAQTTNNPIYVTMPNDGTASVTRKATFAMDTYTLTLKTNDKSMGILVVDPNTTNPAISGPTINNETGTRTYTVNYGTEVVLLATPADHHHLASWSNGATLKELDTIHVTVTKDSTITANFAIDIYKLTLAKSGNGAVEIQGVTTGSKSIITSPITVDYCCQSVDNEGCDSLFDGVITGTNKWGTNAAEKIVRFHTAVPVQVNGYTLYTGNDNADSWGAGRNPKNWVLKAKSGDEWITIANVSNDNTMQNVNYTPFDFNIDVPGTYQYFSFEVSEIHSGNFMQLGEMQLFYQEKTLPTGITPGATTNTYIVNYGTEVTVKATADEHNHFVNWTNEGNTAYNATNVTTDAGTYPVHSYLTFNVTGDTTAQGNFAVNTYDITATVATNCDGMGTVSGGGTYNEAATVTLIATPATGYHFVNWTKTGETSPVSTAATYSFNATAATAGSYIANFAINTYTLTLATDPTDGSQGTLDVVRNNNNELPAGVTGTYPNYTVNEGVYVPLVIAPATHYHLVSLIGGTNQPINYSDNHATIAVNKDSTITATFAIDTYVITATANNSTLGTVSGGGTYNHGVTVTLTATATDSTHFVNWTKEGETNPVSTTATYNFTAEAAGNYTANFAINPTLKLVADGHGTVDTVGVIDGVTLKSAPDKEYYVVPGTVVSVKAKPDAGFVFVQWNDGKTNNPLDTTINSEVTLTATFALPTPGLTPEGEVTVQGNRFVDEHGKIVGSPRLTEHGEFIDNGNSTSPVSLIGKFSVSSTKKVYFSPANLQYTRTSTSVDWSTGTWSFLAHQYSTVETAANPYCTENYGDKTVVGLFGWGTWGEGKTPNLTAYSNSNYTWSTDFSVPLGGYNDWRTLTKDEWIYLLSTRATGVTVNSTSDARYTLATINTDATEVKGMIIFPDGFAGSNTEDVTWGTINANSNYTTTCTSAGWNALEAANCLFLPAAGWRAINDNNDDCTRVGDINTWGYYWTSDVSDNSTFSYTLKFYSQDVELDELALRRLGFPVRLVRDAE